MSKTVNSDITGGLAGGKPSKFHPSGKVTIGSAQFKINLIQFKQAITTVVAATDKVKQDVSEISPLFLQMEDAWRGPAGDTFTTLQGPLIAALNNLVTVLEEIISRMNTTYLNYVNAEAMNEDILKTSQRIDSEIAALKDLINTDQAKINAEIHKHMTAAEIKHVKAEIAADGVTINKMRDDINAQIDALKAQEKIDNALLSQEGL
jgi:uncharacterized protein YukE